MTQVERAALTVLFNRVVLPEAGRDPAAADTAEEALKAPLGVLDRALTATDHLLGKHLTVADLNIAAAILSWARQARPPSRVPSRRSLAAPLPRPARAQQARQSQREG